MEVAGAVDRRDIDQDQFVAPRFEQSKQAFRCFDLARVFWVEGTFPEPFPASDESARQQRTVV